MIKLKSFLFHKRQTFSALRGDLVVKGYTGCFPGYVKIKTFRTKQVVHFIFIIKAKSKKKPCIIGD